MPYTYDQFFLADREIRGTSGSDTISSNTSVILSLGGDDSLSSTASSNYNFLFGGSGNDTYTVAPGSAVTIFDTSGSDRIVAKGLGFYDPNTYVMTLDQQHVASFNTVTGDTLVVLNWLDQDNQIESLELSDATLYLGQLAPILSERPNFLGDYPITTNSIVRAIPAETTQSKITDYLAYIATLENTEVDTNAPVPTGYVLTQYVISLTELGFSLEKLGLNFSFADDISGLDFADVVFRSPSGISYPLVAFRPEDIISGTALDGTFAPHQWSSTINRYSESGTYTLDRIRTVDLSGNEKIYLKGELFDLGIDVDSLSFTVLSDDPLDISGPVPTDFVLTSNQVVITEDGFDLQNLDLRFSFADDLAGFAYANVNFRNPSKSLISTVHYTADSLISGSVSNGEFAPHYYSSKLGIDAELGTYQIESIWAVDANNNGESYTRSDLIALGIDVSGLDFTVNELSTVQPPQPAPPPIVPAPPPIVPAPSEFEFIGTETLNFDFGTASNLVPGFQFSHGSTYSIWVYDNTARLEIDQLEEFDADVLAGLVFNDNAKTILEGEYVAFQSDLGEVSILKMDDPYRRLDGDSIDGVKYSAWSWLSDNLTPEPPADPPQTNVHQLDVIVDLLGQVLYLGDLTETVTTTSHTVEYAGITFNWSDVDSFVTTVVRDNEFTEEFAKEISDAFPSVAGISYQTALTIIGTTGIQEVLLMVAGADGNYVG